MDVVHAFSKGVKDINVVHHSISDFGVIAKIGEMIGKLENLHNAQNCVLEDLGLNLNANRKDWIMRLLGYPDISLNEEIARFLLRDFTDNMKTRMKEEQKYVIGIVSPNRLLVCHSNYGGETITPTWDIIPRMLDTDNVLRFVSFFQDDNKVTKAVYWEKDPSQSFIDWLGLRRKKTFLSGGAFRIMSKMAGMTTELQLDENEIENLIKNHSEFIHNRISLAEPISLLHIDEIRVGSRHYKTSEDFLQVYTADKYGLLPYIDLYNKLMNTLSPVVIKYFDDEDQVVSIPESNIENVEIKKELEGIDILFANQYITLRSNYRDKLVAKIINNDPLRVFHPGCEFSHPPFTLKNIEILNKIKVDDLVQKLRDFYNDTNLQDKTLDSIVKYAIFSRLAIINVDLPIVHFFFELLRGILEILEIKEKKWTKGEDAVLEYKSSDCVKGEDNKIISALADDMVTKLKLNPFKIYILGMEENGNLNPIEKSRLSNDRIEVIRSALVDKLKKLGTIDLYPTRIPVDDRYLLLIAINLKSQLT
jgi:hypothetical protein